MTGTLSWLLGLTEATATPDVFVAGVDAPAGVLAAMAADALVVPVTGGVFIAADRAHLPVARARALAVLIGPALARTGVVGGEAALWVSSPRAMAGRPLAGPVIVLLPSSGAGGSAGRAGAVRVRASALEPADVVEVGAVRITSAVRTGADLARCADADPALLVLLLAAGCPHEAVAAQLRAVDRAPGSHAGLRRLLAAQRLVAGSGLLPAPREPVHVEDTVDPANGPEHMPQVGGVSHLEGEARDRDAIA